MLAFAITDNRLIANLFLHNNYSGYLGLTIQRFSSKVTHFELKLHSATVSRKISRFKIVARATDPFLWKRPFWLQMSTGHTPCAKEMALHFRWKRVISASDISWPHTPAEGTALLFLSCKVSETSIRIVTELCITIYRYFLIHVANLGINNARTYAIQSWQSAGACTVYELQRLTPHKNTERQLVK